MSLLDLFKHHEHVQPDQSWPQDTKPGYYDDTSVAEKFELPPDAVHDWAPTEGKNLPGYRGTQDHGVAYHAHSDPRIVAPKPQSEHADSPADIATEVEVEKKYDAIDVRVVEAPAPREYSYRLVTTQYTLGAVPVEVAPRRTQRTKLTMVASVAGAVLMGPSASAVTQLGYPVGTDDLPLNTTEPVYAVALSGTPTLYLMEEFPVE